MTLASDIAGDYTIFDDTETVTFTPLTGSNTTGVTALRRATGTRQVSGEAMGMDSETATMWSLFTSTLSSAVPVPGCKITDSSSVVWRIQEVAKVTLGSRYRCLCVKEIT
jgi:hypothetical protein